MHAPFHVALVEGKKGYMGVILTSGDVAPMHVREEGRIPALRTHTHLHNAFGLGIQGTGGFVKLCMGEGQGVVWVSILLSWCRPLR